MSKMEYMPVDCLQVPKMLFQMEKYKNLSNTAKILYSLFLDRLKFAVQNGWVDGEGDLFVIYPKSEMKKDLNTTRYGVDQAVQELVQVGNLVRIISDNGKANHFYINDIYENEMEEESMMTLDSIMANMPMEEREIIMDKMVKASRDILETIADMGYLDEYETPLTSMEERNYRDELGQLDIDQISCDGYEFGMDLAFGILEENEENADRVLDIQKYVNRQHKKCSKKKFMKVLETLVHAIGNDEGFIADMYACDKEATGSLTDVTFDVFAAEDIKAADGVSEDYFKADEKVGTITTDSNGIAQMGDLPAGKYYVKEVKTAHGYVLDKEPRYVDLSYRDQDTPVITYDEKWQNARQKVKVTVLKKEKDTERVLAGGVFGLYTSEDIKNAKGEVLLEKDSLIEQRVTDKKGQITFTANLPVDGKYYVKEIFAPDGFVTTEEIQEFTFEYAGEDQAEVSYDFTFENQPTTVELTKTDLTTGKELPGAHLKVTDSDGNTVDEWTSTEESHVIKELVVGKEYTMTETKPADGYVTAESITFTVENTAEIQKVEMKDDVTKVQISKTDITGETEIPGAKLTILDKNDQVVESWTSTEEAHYIEKLPIGKYTLREEQAPKGYLLTSDVSFEVKDTGEIQKVAMKDDTAKGKVILNKTDKSSGEPLKGVEFELRDSKGKVLETLKTDAAGHAESKLYEIATFKNGKYDTAIKYYLVETKTLDGYTLDQNKHEVTFAYADDSTPVVEVTFNLTNEKPEVPETPNTPQSHEETKVSNAPKTGDSTNIWLPILLLVISTGGMAGLYISRKRK